MDDLTWGVLGPETVPGERRTRTLGLGTAVRHFNELAVPGLGGVWFGKQLFLAMLGIAVAERVRHLGRRHDNIQVANAIEALGCWLAYRHNERRPDDRLKGIEKLAGANESPRFATFGQRGFYVTQPMRMGTVQTLLALRLVESGSERFNAYHCSAVGAAWLEAGYDGVRPWRMHALDALVKWVIGELEADTSTMRMLVSPVEPLPAMALEQLRECLTRGDSEVAARRRAATAWMQALAESPGQTPGMPPQLTEEHWHDLQAGTHFFSLQRQALAVLDAVEAMLAASGKDSVQVNDVLTEVVVGAIQSLRDQAKLFISHGFADADGTGANEFARECSALSDKQIVEHLLLRDERVLRLREGMVLPGQAFDPGMRVNAAAENGPVSAIPVPPDMSYRVRNLYLLNRDLRGELHAFLTGSAAEETVE